MLAPDWIILAFTCFAAAAFAAAFLKRAWDGPHAAQRETLVLTEPEFKKDATAEILELAPIAIWKTDAAGILTWGNHAYRSLCRWRGLADEKTPLFPTCDRSLSDGTAFRAALQSGDQTEPEWFDVSTCTQGEDTVWFAQNVSALVSIEDSKKSFHQIMAGTFAQLSTGLAIFDRDLRLNLFNPALVDLCGVPFAFLSSRPDLTSFFDRLRETQSMPEPNDYSAWRAEMEDLARAAAEGRYQETWTLPTGSVYQVTGRPHPGGAIAFLFEDISAEVGLARQFRTDIALYQSALNTSETAICVFTAAEELKFTNQAYDIFWDVQPDQPLRGLALDKVCAGWQRDTGHPFSPEAILGALANSQNPPFSDQFTAPDGSLAELEVKFLPGGDMILRFRKLTSSLEIIQTRLKTA